MGTIWLASATGQSGNAAASEADFSTLILLEVGEKELPQAVRDERAILVAELGPMLPDLVVEPQGKAVRADEFRSE